MDEFEKRHRLRRIQLIALALLPLMAIMLVVSGSLKSTHPEFAAVQFFAEASLIGGLGDRFAVVALFRHPFGLPLPHTAIVRENKDRIGQELGRFIEQNSVTSETIAPWLTKQDLVGRRLRWGSKPANIRTLPDGNDLIMDRAARRRLAGARGRDAIHPVFRHFTGRHFGDPEVAEEGQQMNPQPDTMAQGRAMPMVAVTPVCRG